MSDPADAQLLRAWRGGDQRAGAQLYRNHANLVGRFFRNKVAARDVADLIQATFMVCFEHSDRLRDDVSFRAFVLGFARNVLYRHYRDKYRKHDKIDFGVSSIVDLGITPTAILAAEQHEKLLLTALRSLSIEHQTLLELYYWDGFRGPELAQVYELPEGTIRTRLRRARQLLASTFAALERAEQGEQVASADGDPLEDKIRRLRDRVGGVPPE